MIILDRIIDHDSEKDDGAAYNAAYECIEELIKPGFSINGYIASCQGKKDQPPNRNCGATQPKTIGKEQPMLIKNGLPE